MNPSRRPRLPSITILCRDLQPSPATTQALEFGHWLRRTDRAEVVETISQFGGTQHASFASLGRVHIVHHPAWEPPWDLSLLDEVRRPGTHGGPRKPPRKVPSPPGRHPANVATSLIRGARLERVAAGADGARLRRALRARTGPVWLAGPSAARLLHYVPTTRAIIANQPDVDARWDEMGPDSPDRPLLIQRPKVWVVSTPGARAQLEAQGVTGEIVEMSDVLYLDNGPVRREITRENLNERCNVGEGQFLIGTMGDIDWWDEPDLFVQLAWELRRRPEAENIRMVWLAGKSSDRRLWPLHHDIGHAGVQDMVNVVGFDVEPLDGLAALDVIVLTRRGVPEPPRMSRIIQSGVPVVRPVRPGEEPTNLPHDRVVPALDEKAMADAVLAVLADLETARASALLAREQHDVRAIGPDLVELIERATVN